MGFFDLFKKKNNLENEIDEKVVENLANDEAIQNGIRQENFEEEIKENLNKFSENFEEESVNLNEKKEEENLEIKEDLEKDVENIESFAEERENAELEVEEIEKAEDIKEEAEEKIEDIEPEEVEEEKAENIEFEEVEKEEEVAEVKEEKRGIFAKIKAGISKTRSNILSSVDNVLKAFGKVDEELFEELEEALIMSDIGVDTSLYIIEKLREKVKDEKITETSEIRKALISVITEILEKEETALELPSPSVVLVIGVNGVGKTTSIGKLAHNYISEGKSVLLAAADTFRAAAIDQLQIWGDRNGCEVIKHQENSDPAAVIFDAIKAAKARKTDVLICDTAGRLHNKKNLMEELRKIARVIEREYPEAHTEVFLVLDATTGQNAMQQAKLFNEVADISGLVLTKLDGTAKGGIILAIKHEMNIPVRYIGIGEKINDLQKFNSSEFAKALFDEE